MEELNKKLAKWAGFFYGWSDNPKTMETEGGWYYPLANPKTCMQVDLPNFTQSLDTCFKWLMPKVIGKIMSEQECSSDVAYGILFKKWLQELELMIPEASLSLCLSIEKLIDGEKKG